MRRKVYYSAMCLLGAVVQLPARSAEAQIQNGRYEINEIGGPTKVVNLTASAGASFIVTPVGGGPPTFEGSGSLFGSLLFMRAINTTGGFCNAFYMGLGTTEFRGFYFCLDTPPPNEPASGVFFMTFVPPPRPAGG